VALIRSLLSCVNTWTMEIGLGYEDKYFRTVHSCNQCTRTRRSVTVMHFFPPEKAKHLFLATFFCPSRLDVGQYIPLVLWPHPWNRKCSGVKHSIPLVRHSRRRWRWDQWLQYVYAAISFRRKGYLPLSIKDSLGKTRYHYNQGIVPPVTGVILFLGLDLV
jgi:hypothetical protein